MMLQTEELLRLEQERTAQLESYAADLSRTYAELRRQYTRLAVLHELNTQVAATLDPDEVVRAMLGSLDRLVSYHSARVYLCELESPVGARKRAATARERLPRVAGARLGDGQWLSGLQQTLPPKDGAVMAAMQSQRTTTLPLTEGEVEVAIPLRAVGGAIGALALRVERPLEGEEQKVLELLTAHAAAVLNNAFLHRETQRLATIDAMTGINNSYQFQQALELEVERARRLAYPVGLLVLDLDFFKAVNDRHGHPIGNVALRRTATQLRLRLRRTDTLGRLGGEEFGVVLPGAQLLAVANVGEKLRRGIEVMPPVRGGMDPTPTPLTISVGGTCLGPEEVDAQRLMEWADRALYEAKHAGRNRVRLWQEGASVSPEQLAAPLQRQTV
jgi:diguanylate cyclase (GGDEF)-like protein